MISDKDENNPNLKEVSEMTQDEKIDFVMDAATPRGASDTINWLMSVMKWIADGTRAGYELGKAHSELDDDLKQGLMETTLNEQHLIFKKLHEWLISDDNGLDLIMAVPPTIIATQELAMSNAEDLAKEMAKEMLKDMLDARKEGENN